MSTISHEWWQTGVVYQIYPRSFRDSSGDGTGDLAGIIERLDYLADTLGIDALWLSPFYPSPMADFGYDVSDYVDVDPIFGDLDTIDRLLVAAHRRGLRVIIDFVPNHSSDQHPWFLESRSSRTSPRRNWYVWRDPRPGGAPPNNWLSIFGGGAWEWDDLTGQYYLHSFLKEQPDLNWRNPEVKDAMFDVVRFWLDRGVDGLRVDMAHGIMKDPELRDNPTGRNDATSFHRPLGEYDRQVHVHDKGHDDVHDVYRELRILMDGYEERKVAIGELHIYDLEKWVRYYGADLDGLHMPFNFSLLNTAWDPAAVRATVEALEDALPDGAWPNYVLGNHDEPRLATRLGIEHVRIAGMLLLTLRGTPTLYYGDELGMRDVPIAPERVQDPWGIGQIEFARDPCRTPMPWNGSPSGGFSAAAPEDLWLPLGEDHDRVNVESESADPHSVLNFYRAMLALRRRERALQVGSYRSVPDTPRSVFAFVRRHENRQLLIALNFSSEPATLTTPPARILLSTELDRSEEVNHQPLELRSHEGLILEL